MPVSQNSFHERSSLFGTIGQKIASFAFAALRSPGAFLGFPAHGEDSPLRGEMSAEPTERGEEAVERSETDEVLFFTLWGPHPSSGLRRTPDDTYLMAVTISAAQLRKW